MEPLIEGLGLDADDAETIVRAIETSAARLQAMSGRGEADAIAGALVRRAGHPRAKVRQAVAEAALHLPEDAFQTVISQLLQDSNAFVKRAATRSYDERSRRERVARDQEQRSADILRLRARIEDTHGTEALRLADQVCDRALGQFVHGLLHEIVKVAMPLRGAMADVRAKVRAGAGDRAQLEASANDAHRMLELLLGIAESARSHAQVKTPTYREENVRALVEEQLGLLRARIGDARLGRLRVEVAIDAALTFEADLVLLAQAFANLLQNAVESYEAEGDQPIFVGIEAERRKGGTLIAVAVIDRGRGIEKEAMPHIGEPFLSSKGGGRGLGVLNVRKMVEVAHGGVLEIESELGVGTKAIVVLPRKQAARDNTSRS